MRNIKILVASFVFLISFTACNALKFPEFPSSVKTQHMVVISEGVGYCFEFEIISTNPYKISAEPKVVELMKCDGLSGFIPDNMKLVTNWVDDVQIWADKHTCQLKR